MEDSKRKNEKISNSSILFQSASATWTQDNIFMPVAAATSNDAATIINPVTSEAAPVFQSGREACEGSVPPYRSAVPSSETYPTLTLSTFHQNVQPPTNIDLYASQDSSYSDNVPEDDRDQGLSEVAYKTTEAASNLDHEYNSSREFLPPFYTSSHTYPSFSTPDVSDYGQALAPSYQQVTQGVPSHTMVNKAHQNANKGQTSVDDVLQSSNKTTILADVSSTFDESTNIPVQYHWCFMEIVEKKELWFGFSAADSAKIEDAYQNDLQNPQEEDIVVPTNGGRYDVYIRKRQKIPIYWEEPNQFVRRCTWFYKSENIQRYVPYDEAVSNALEELYYNCVINKSWQQKLNLDGGEYIVLEGPNSFLHYTNGFDSWSTLADNRPHPRIVIRGVPGEFLIMYTEADQIDHLVFLVQGIGSVCDLKFRTVSQCVDGFRELADHLIPVHFKQEVESGHVGRIEFLPVAWHATLHEDSSGFDRCMKSITLPSIPKLRHFTNDTLLDILLYSSPLYCQTVLDTVAYDINRAYHIFLERNPQFTGKVSVAGHSLGSLILFDMLSNQTAISNDANEHNASTSKSSSNLNLASDQPSDKDEGNIVSEELASETVTSILTNLGLEDYIDIFIAEKIDVECLALCGDDDLKSLGLPLGPRKKLLNYLMQEKTAVQPEVLNEETTEIMNITEHTQNKRERSSSVYPVNSVETALSSISFPKLDFNPVCFFALGSPISMFLVVRGFSTISDNFKLPTCSNFFHIFHPYDPVAFRIEPLINPNTSAPPVVIPHHMGRKRMHIEIRENIAKMGLELKQKIFSTVRYTLSHLNVFSSISRSTMPSTALETEVNKNSQQAIKDTSKQNKQEFDDEFDAPDDSNRNADVNVGCLNGGRRIDYVLQEKPIEALNEYIFALTSHATYWNSEDTVLMILKEIYASIGVIPLYAAETSHFSPTLPCTSNNEDNTSSNLSSVPSVVGGFTPINRTDNMVGMSQPSTSMKMQPHLPPTTSSSSSSGPPPLSGFVKKSPFSKH